MSLVESFRTSPQRRQLTVIAVGTAALCALLFAVYFLVLRKPYDVLFTDLRPMDAATIVAELDKKKVPYRLEDGGGTIMVPKNLVDATRLSVMSSDLPLKGMVGFELFNKSDMGLTEFAQKINYQRALQGELARTIMTMEAVDTARVHLSITQPTVFRGDRIAPKASVTILTRPGKVLTPGAVQGIQRLVAAAIPELELANVVVLDRRGEVLSGWLPLELSLSPMVQSRRAIEDYYAGRVRIALLRTVPADAVDVSVSAPALSVLPSIEGWNPAARDFGLRVSISAAIPLTQQAVEDLRYLAAEAIGLNAALGDSVAIAISPAAPAPTLTAPSVAPAPWTATEASALNSGRLSVLNIGLVLVLPLLLLLFVAAFLFERRRGGVRMLTVQQRGEYTQRLKSLLEREEADAV